MLLAVPLFALDISTTRRVHLFWVRNSRAGSKAGVIGVSNLARPHPGPTISAGGRMADGGHVWLRQLDGLSLETNNVPISYLELFGGTKALA